MTIIAFLHEKGGVGKTTCATNIARALSLESPTLLVDADPQESALDWHARSGGTTMSVVGIARPTLPKDIEIFKNRYDYIIVDGGGKMENMSAAVIRCADVVLIPIQPSPYDIWPAGSIIEAIKNRQTIMNGSPKVAFVINGDRSNTTLSKEMEEVLSKFEIPILSSRLSYREDFKKTAARGLGVVDIKGPAASEMHRLAEEIKEFVK